MSVFTFSLAAHPMKVSAATAILQPGKMYWGANGHFDQNNVYASIPIHQQVLDLKNIFGYAPNTILYRAFTNGQSNLNSDVLAFQNEGIVPVVIVVADYPTFGNFANETAAYNWAYDNTTAVVQSAPSVQIYEIGNEWILIDPLKSEATAPRHLSFRFYRRPVLSKVPRCCGRRDCCY
jgi:hypothetical protein